ncbi:uncharacterized protein [Ptychodera flava]|uniref:uncharacterized protein n=1 Tax=Ptychodera flava TaxID=63121 RepID=UPI00396A61D1
MAEKKKRRLAGTSSSFRPISSYFGGNGKFEKEKGCESPSGKKSPQKYDRDDSRSLRNGWFSEFPWLIHDRTGGLLKCKMCIDANLQNVFTSGKPDKAPKKDDLTKHARTKEHRFAASRPVLQRDMKCATSSAYSKIKDSIVAQLRTVYTMAKEQLSSRKMEALMEMQVLNVGM